MSGHEGQNGNKWEWKSDESYMMWWYVVKWVVTININNLRKILRYWSGTYGIKIETDPMHAYSSWNYLNHFPLICK